MPTSRSAAALACCALLAGLALALSACDAAPGLPDAPGRPPVVRGLAVTPDSVRIDRLGPDRLLDSTAVVDFSIVADVDDPDGRVDSVYLVFTSPTAGAEPRLQLRLDERDGVYGASFDLVISAVELGRFGLVVYAVDESGLTASARATLVVANPLVRRASLTPDPFVRGRDSVLTVTATAAHPGGPGAIAAVLGQVAGAPDAFALVDDGSPASGDSAAGDGTFSARIAFDGVPPPGTFGLSVRAFGPNGLPSDPVTVRTTIQ
jgi:hypothetical protein